MNELLRKENDYLRSEVGKSRKESEKLRRQVEIVNVKNDIIVKEMVKRIEEIERQSNTVVETAVDENLGYSSVSKVMSIELEIDKLFPNDALRGDILSSGQAWRNKVQDIFDKLEEFER
jgi:hypothetical protein